MNDSDPRPMPPQVLAAYRDPLNLTELLASEVFTDRDRLAVRDELLEKLVSKHGNVEVETGKSGKLVPIRQRITQFKNNAWGSIEVMIAAEELGGRDAVMLELASVMQPYWLRWWEAMSWDSYDSTNSSTLIADHVLGRRQLTWLAAQYARSVVGLSSERQVSVDAISAAEAWAIVPSEENRERAKRAFEVANAAVRAAAANANAYDAANAAAYDAGAYYAAYVSESAAYAAAYAYADAAAYAALAATNAAYAAAYAYADAAAYAAARYRLCELTKRLITPTLITRPSRGLR